MGQTQINRFPLNEKFSGLSSHEPNYAEKGAIYNFLKFFFIWQFEQKSIFCVVNLLLL